MNMCINDDLIKIKNNKININFDLEDILNIISNIDQNIIKQIIKNCCELESIDIDTILSPILKCTDANDFIEYFLNNIDYDTVVDFVIENGNPIENLKSFSEDNLKKIFYDLASKNPKKWVEYFIDDICENNDIYDELEKYIFTKSWLCDITFIYELIEKYQKDQIDKLLEYADIHDHIDMFVNHLQFQEIKEEAITSILDMLFTYYSHVTKRYIQTKECNTLKQKNDIEYLKKIDFDVILDFVAKNIKKGN